MEGGRGGGRGKREGGGSGGEEQRRGIRIVQINCNKSTNVRQGVIEIASNADIIAIQEP